MRRTGETAMRRIRGAGDKNEWDLCNLCDGGLIGHRSPINASRLIALSLLNHSRLGSSILRPGRLVMAGVRRHLKAEADRLYSRAGNT